MGQKEKWNQLIQHIEYINRVYEPEKARRSAQTMFDNLEKHKANIGEENTKILLSWIHSQGIGLKPNPDSWAEVFRLFFRYWKKTKRENFTPLELVRVLVWSAMGFKP